MRLDYILISFIVVTIFSRIPDFWKKTFPTSKTTVLDNLIAKHHENNFCVALLFATMLNF